MPPKRFSEDKPLMCNDAKYLYIPYTLIFSSWQTPANQQYKKY